eukprot:728518-Pyramimonas_sp.AAC.1
MPPKPSVNRMSRAERKTFALPRNRSGVEMNMRTSESAGRPDSNRGSNGRYGQQCMNCLPEFGPGLRSGWQDNPLRQIPSMSAPLAPWIENLGSSQLANSGH